MLLRSKKFLHLFLWSMAFSLIGCGVSIPDKTTPEMAQNMLKLRGYHFTEEEFCRSIRSGDIPAFRGFLDGGINGNAKCESGETPLTLAVQKSDKALIKLLLEKSDINLRDSLGNSPLYMAVKKDRMDIFEMLLDKNVDVNSRGNDYQKEDQTVLAAAISLGRVEFIKKLFEKGVNPNLSDKYGVTPLEVAVSVPEINLETIKLLLDKGAEVNARDEKGRTALIFAAANFYADRDLRVEAAKLLIERGADKTVRDAEGLTAFDRAKKNEYEGLFEVLK